MTPTNQNPPSKELKYCITCEENLPENHLHRDKNKDGQPMSKEVEKKINIMISEAAQHTPLGAAIEALRNDLYAVRYESKQAIGSVTDRLAFLEEHHTRQIDENRKISRRVDEIQNFLSPEGFAVLLSRIEKLEGDVKLGVLTTKETLWDKEVNDRIEKLEQITLIANYKEFIDDINYRLNRLDERLDSQKESIEKLLVQTTLGTYQGDISLRIEKLEQAYKADAEVAKEILFSGARNNEQIKNNDDFIKYLEIRLYSIEEDIGNLITKVATRESVADAFTQLRDNTNERLRILEQMHTENVYKPIESGKKPYKCPVCEGNCMRPNPLKGSENAMLPVNLDCIVCEGKGILWG